MANVEDTQPPAVGVYWIAEKDYAALRNIFVDGKKMPSTWQAWVKMAEEMENGLKSYGHAVMRVHIDPKTFSAWCNDHGTSPDRDARKRFVAAAVKDRYGDQK